MPTKYKSRAVLIDENKDLIIENENLSDAVHELLDQKKKWAQEIKEARSVGPNPQSIAHEAVKTFKLGLIKSMMN